MNLKFAPPLELPPGTPAHIGARCEVINGEAVIGFLERHDFCPGKTPSSGRFALDIEDIPPSSCYAFRDLNGWTQFASRDRDGLLQRIREVFAGSS